MIQMMALHLTIVDKLVKFLPLLSTVFMVYADKVKVECLHVDTQKNTISAVLLDS